MRRAGLDRRDVILVQLPNWHEFVTLAVAAEIAGVVFAFCPIAWDARETQRALRLTQPRLWFTTHHPRPRRRAHARSIAEACSSIGGTRATCLILARSPEVDTDAAFERWAADIEIDPGAPVAGAP